MWVKDSNLSPINTTGTLFPPIYTNYTLFYSKFTQQLYNTVYKSNIIEDYLPEVHGGSSKCLRRIVYTNEVKDKMYHPYLIRDICCDKKNQMIFVLEYNSKKSNKCNNIKKKQLKDSHKATANHNLKYYKVTSTIEDKNSNWPIEGSIHVYSYKGEYMRNIKANPELHVKQADIMGIAFSESE